MALFCKTLLNRGTHVPLHNGTRKMTEKFLRNKSTIILGIESSCDDTGCGIVDDKGNILGEAVHSQQNYHLSRGGIVPTTAADFHAKHITSVCEDALRSANLRLRDIDAIATTVMPGLPMSLEIGTRFGKYLSRIGNKPFIPIHHMEAHALTARMIEKVDFPYLVLLISGGHCLLAIVKDVETFYLLGSTIDNAPGELIDKVSRRLKLRYIPEFDNMSGGRAIEIAAQKATNPERFTFFPIMTDRYDCNFSFSGLASKCIRYIKEEEEKHGITSNKTIPDAYNLCAAFQLALIRHVCHRTQRAMQFIQEMSLIPNDKLSLVASGGVASNNMLAKALGILCDHMNFKFVRTPPKLCTDNGVMIAWNGMERWIANKGILTDRNEIENVSIVNKAPLGEDWREKVEKAKLKCKWVQVTRATV